MDYVSEIIVYQNQRPSRGHRVRLSFDGFLSGGMTGDFYTDSDGVARVRRRGGSRGGKGRGPGPPLRLSLRPGTRGPAARLFTFVGPRGTRQAARTTASRTEAVG